MINLKKLDMKESIKQNFASSISNKLSSELILINDFKIL
jgi:hypothetical protein